MDKGTFSAEIIALRQAQGYATVSFRRIVPHERIISIHAREAGLIFDIHLSQPDAYRLWAGASCCPVSVSIYKDTQKEEPLDYTNHEGELNLIRHEAELKLVFFPNIQPTFQGEPFLVKIPFGGAEFLKELQEAV